MTKKVIDVETGEEIIVEEVKKTWKDKLPTKETVKKVAKKAALIGGAFAGGVLFEKVANKRNKDEDIVDTEVTEEEVYTSEF